MVADKGAYLSFNCGGGHLDSAKGVRQAMMLVKILAQRGYLSQITLSADAGFWPHESQRLDPDKSCPEGNSPRRTYRCVFSLMLPALEKMEVTHSQIRRMLVDNPRRHLNAT